MKPYVLGIDIGGTNTVFGLVDARGKVIASSSIKTGKHSKFADYLDELYTEATRLIQANDAVDKVHGIGIGAPNANYYTGTIIEVKAADVEIGSITGGGRYDNLTGVFGMPGLSGVGISFGADRIYDVMNQLDLYPAEVTCSVRVLFVNFGEREALQAMKYVKAIREAGIPAELYPDAAKLKKQMAMADSDRIPYVAFVGESELDRDSIVVKDMTTGEQRVLTLSRTIELLKQE